MIWELVALVKWIATMKLALNALNVNIIRELVTLSTGVVPIGSKWKYKIKRHTRGTFKSYKTRLVAQGFTQLRGYNILRYFSQ